MTEITSWALYPTPICSPASLGLLLFCHTPKTQETPKPRYYEYEISSWALYPHPHVPSCQSEIGCEGFRAHLWPQDGRA